MIEIDGSQGEGGGQIIRSSLALSVVTGQAFSVRNVRGKRKKPGLLKQQLTALRAAREVCGAEVTGADLHSGRFSFTPGPVQCREFQFDVGSAGSATLVAQTVLPALMLADSKSSLTISGGTHNMSAPPLDYLQRVYLPQVEKLGPRFSTSIDRYGFYPVGGGRFTVDIEPSPQLRSLELLERHKPTIPSVRAVIANLPRHIGEREVDTIRKKSNWHSARCHVVEVDSPGPGNAVMIELASKNVCEISTGFGRQGIPAEDVARAAYRQAKKYLMHDAPVGQFLADQLMLPLGLAAAQGKSSRFRTAGLTPHSLTQIDILKRFLNIQITIHELAGGICEVGFEPGSTTN